MTLVGLRNFIGGQTLKKRVSPHEHAVLERCSGYDPSDGSLLPEKTHSTLSSGLASPPAEQTPIVFGKQSGAVIVAQDGDDCIREFAVDTATWSGKGAEIVPLTESIPARMGRQIIYPTSEGLMVYEPGSPYTNLRPLSFKSPCDYDESAKPVVEASSTAVFSQLFDCDDANPWTAEGVGCSVSTNGDSAVLTVDSTAENGANLLFSKNTAQVSVTAKMFLVLDVSYSGLTRTYSQLGLFANDPSLMPSGFELRLYHDADCTGTALASLRIPAFISGGDIHRFVLRLPDGLTGAVKSIGIYSSAFFVAPDDGEFYSLTVYSEAWDANWRHKGNLLCPAVAWTPSPWAEKLLEGAETADVRVTTGINLVEDPGFEENQHPAWQFGGDTALTTAGSRSGTWCVELGGGNAWARQASGHYAPVTEGFEYEWEIWYLSYEQTGGEMHVEVWFYTDNDSGTHISGEDITFPESGSWKVQFGWPYRKLSGRFTAPPRANYASLMVYSHDGVDKRIDDVAVYPVERTPAGSAWLLERFTAGGISRNPDSPLARWVYCFCGRDKLTDDYSIMISNPSEASSPDAFADPWRTYALNITLPENAARKTVLHEYNSWVTHILIYRQLYDGETQTWSTWKLVKLMPILNQMRVVDDGVDVEPLLENKPLPEELEITNDFASTARYVVFSEGRVYAACLDYDSNSNEWKRPTAIEVSSSGKPWAFPTTNDENSPVTYGTELDGYAMNGSEVRGLVTLGDDRIVFLDAEFFILRGDNPWRFIYGGPIGCVSNRSIADCGGMVIWHSGNDFYAYHGEITCISRMKVDSSLIDWQKPHKAVFLKDKYICWCEHDSESVLLIYDIPTGAWHRSSTPANTTLVGICTDGSTLYGLQSDGCMLNLFGKYAQSGSPFRREVWTQYVELTEPGCDLHIRRGIVGATTNFDEDVDIELEYCAVGLKNCTQTAVVTVTLTRSRYQVNLNLMGDAVKIKALCTSSYPPNIHYLGVMVDETPAR